MNDKGQNLMFAIMTAVVIFMAGMLFMNHMMGEVSLARSVGIDCDSTGISDGAKVTCIGFDFIIPIMILTIISTAIGAILSRFLI
jgi:hypothetical protein